MKSAEKTTWLFSFSQGTSQPFSPEQSLEQSLSLFLSLPSSPPERTAGRALTGTIHLQSS